MLAALASAAMPSIVMAGVRDSERANDTDDAAGIVTGSASYAGGRAGFGVYVSDANRVVAFDQIAIEAQT